METLVKNETWVLAPLSNSQKIVGCKCVLSIKYKADGSIKQYNARLVAKGYTHRYGVACQEKFTLVGNLNTVSVLLSLAANLD